MTDPTADEFTKHLARVRERFAAKLPGKLDDSFAALGALGTGGPDSIETVIVAHRRLHEICGIAPTLGFPATGTSARAAETALRDAAKTKRALAPAEIDALKSGLDTFRAAALAELETFSRQT
jgi:HPt (histidine-containing phosphotransfer) domain-containing protein